MFAFAAAAPEPAPLSAVLRELAGQLRRFDNAVPAALAVALVWHGNWLLSLLASVALMLWLGASTLAACRVRPSSATLRLLAAASVGLVLFCVTSLVPHLVGALVGVSASLLRLGLAASTAAVLIALGRVCQARRCSPQEWLGVTSSPAAVLLAVLPAVAAAFGATVLAGGGSAVASYVAVAVSAGCVVLALTGDDALLPAALFGVAWALALATTFRSAHLFGFDINQELGVATATTAWRPSSTVDPYASMLSITLLPRSLQLLFGLGLTDFFKLLCPAALAMSALGCFQLVRVWCSGWFAALTTLTLVGMSATFAKQFPAIGRQEVASMVLLSALGIAGDDKALTLRSRRVLLSVLFGALGFIHYSTAYVAVGLLAGSWMLSTLLYRKVGSAAIVSGSVVVVATALIALWNFGVTSAGLSLGGTAASVSDSGLSLLPSGGNLVEAWMAGTAPERISAADYSASVAERTADGDLTWMTVAASAKKFPLIDSQAPVMAGVVGWATPAWTLATLTASQLLIIASSVMTVLALIVARRKQDAVLFLAGSVAAMAVALSALLRLSGGLAVMYNPERQALVTNMLVAPLIAALLSHWGRLRAVRHVAVGFAGVSFMASSGLVAVLFGGAPNANHSTFGEDVERFVVSDNDVAAAGYLNTVPPPGGLVQTDRYGQLAVLSLPDRNFGWVPTVAPVGIDRAAYVLRSSENARSGRGRGEIDGNLAVFQFPDVFLDATREVVYENGKATVWR